MLENQQHVFGEHTAQKELLTCHLEPSKAYAEVSLKLRWY